MIYVVLIHAVFEKLDDERLFEDCNTVWTSFKPIQNQIQEQRVIPLEVF